MIHAYKALVRRTASSRAVPLSLRLQVTLALLVPLVLALAAFSYLEYRTQRQLLLGSLQRASTNAGRIIEGSLQHAVLMNDFSSLQQIMDDIAKQPGVENLFLLSKDGRVILSAGNRLDGLRMDIAAPTCQACHANQEVSRNESIILTDEQGVPAFRNISALENDVACQRCHGAEDATIGVLISDFSMAPVQRELAAYGTRRLLWSLGSIVAVLLIANLVMSRVVVSRLERFTSAIRRVSRGELDTAVVVDRSDEIGLLAEAFNQMTEGLKEKQRLEESLQAQTLRLQAQTANLSALNAIATAVNQSLNLRPILDGALSKVLELLRLRVGWIALWNEAHQSLELVASQGLPPGLVETIERDCLQAREAENEPCGQERAQAWAVHEPCCPAVEALQQHGLVLRACVPLASRNRRLGSMSLAGAERAQGEELAPEALELLTVIGQQIGIAIENASLYEEVRQKEALRSQLLERVMTVQEEERKRIARELHDQTGQPLTSLMMTLRALEEARSLDEVRGQIEDLRQRVSQTLSQVHELALALRPSVLDDLGLLAAMRHDVREYQDRWHIPVDLQALGLSNQRLPSEVETALYRIMQEALSNVARHARAQNVSVLLENRGDAVVLVVEDDGQGFAVEQVMDAHPHERNLGLYGMRERAALLHGSLTIQSAPGAGTAVFVEIPLGRGREGDAEDSPVSS